MKNNILNKRIEKAYWLWLELTKEDKKKIQKIKNLINQKLKGPGFDVHLPLLGPYFKMGQNDIKLIKKISKKISKFKIQLIKYDFTDKKYTSLFIKVKKSKKISLVRKKFFKTNYLKQYSKYQPHISLYYGETDTKLKKKIISKLPKLNKTVTIDKLSISDVDEKINKWKIIKRIKLSEKKN